MRSSSVLLAAETEHFATQITNSSQFSTIPSPSSTLTLATALNDGFVLRHRCARPRYRQLRLSLHRFLIHALKAGEYGGGGICNEVRCLKSLLLYSLLTSRAPDLRPRTSHAQLTFTNQNHDLTLTARASSSATLMVKAVTTSVIMMVWFKLVATIN
jgi:hypothetical protein